MPNPKELLRQAEHERSLRMREAQPNAPAPAGIVAPLPVGGAPLAPDAQAVKPAPPVVQTPPKAPLTPENTVRVPLQQMGVEKLPKKMSRINYIPSGQPSLPFVPMQPPEAPHQEPVAAPAQYVAVPREIRQNSIYHQLMQNHNRARSQHVKG